MKRFFSYMIGGLLTAVLAVGLVGTADATGKTKKGKSGNRPTDTSRSKTAPDAYFVFLDTAKDNATAGEKAVKATQDALVKSFTRPGYVLNTTEENAPTDSTELAKWLRDKKRTGIRLDLVLESVKESEENGNTRFDAKVRAAVFTHPSGWLILSTTGSAAAVGDGLSLDEELKAAAVEGAANGLVENIAAYLAKKPVPIDK